MHDIRIGMTNTCRLMGLIRSVRASPEMAGIKRGSHSETSTLMILSKPNGQEMIQIILEFLKANAVCCGAKNSVMLNGLILLPLKPLT